jgi:hypothetical protein
MFGLTTILAFIAGGIVGATVGAVWVNKQLASAKADLAAVVAKFAPQFIQAVLVPTASKESVAAAVASAKK